MKKLLLTWTLILLLVFAPIIAKAVIPILLAEGVELIVAGGTEVALPAATSAGINATWTAILTGLGSAAAYLALKDSAGNAVRVPMGSAVPAPSAPSTAGTVTQTVYQYNGNGSYGSGLAACQAYVAVSGSGVVFDHFTAPPGCSYRIPAVFDTAVLTDNVIGTATITSCAAGYTLSGSTCNLASARTASPDQKCDVSRSGTTYTYYSDDPDCSISGNIHGTVGGSGSTLEVAGVDQYGNMVRNVITANSDGSTMIQQQVQTMDAAGNSTVNTKTASFDSSGNLTGQSQSSALGSLSAASGQTATVTPAPSGSVGSTGGQSITFPNDYNREATQQQIKTDIETLHTDLTATTTAPTDPAPSTTSDVQGTLSLSSLTSLSGWSLPSHTSTCPTMTFAVFGATKVIDAHCALMTANLPAMSTAFILVYVVMALFIVLRA